VSERNRIVHTPVYTTRKVTIQETANTRERIHPPALYSLYLRSVVHRFKISNLVRFQAVAIHQCSPTSRICAECWFLGVCPVSTQSLFWRNRPIMRPVYRICDLPVTMEEAMLLTSTSPDRMRRCDVAPEHGMHAQAHERGPSVLPRRGWGHSTYCR